MNNVNNLRNMKTKSIILYVAIAVFAIMMESCQKETDTQKNGVVLPSRFKVAIPTSLTNGQSLKSTLIIKNGDADSAKGNDIYANLNTFIAVGKGAGDIVENIIGAIALYKIEKLKTVTYEGGDDHRIKSMVVSENAAYQGRIWEYMLTVVDAASVTNPDSGKALQVFWNNSPIEGIAILKPYNIDRTHNLSALETVFDIEYSEVATMDYDTHMIVEIAGFPMPDAKSEPYAIKSLKMFVGKKGENVDVFGNSNHPNAKFFTQSIGFDWAFVASGADDKNIAVAEVGLPPSNLDNSTRSVLLNDYSIKKVFTQQVNDWFYQLYKVYPDSTQLSKYLHNADAPGFFNSNGFIQAGTAPNADYNQLVSRIGDLTPYNPKAVNDLQILFK